MALWNRGEKGVPMQQIGRQGAGIPGVQEAQGLSPEMTAIHLTRKDSEPIITEKDVKEAGEVLRRYKEGKANLEHRVVDDELWWEQRHWESIGKTKGGNDKQPRSPEPTSAWLFNAILNKHADAMDNYPEPVVLPREFSDKDSAKILSEVLPVILEYNNFEKVYSDNWWEKLKHGTGAYGIYWDTEKENGLGDIDIRQIDLLNLFWEPGITDIQKSRNLFITELVDNDLLAARYPEHERSFKSAQTVDVKQYLFDDTVDTSKKSVVVDWYYKVRGADGRTLLHYAKFVGDTLLYASQNDPNYRDTGFYDHGKYPVVLDVLFPEKGTPVGFGYVAICKDPQLYIDKLSGNILESSMMNTKKRFFASRTTNINKEQFLDWNQPIVDVEGELNDTRLREIACEPLDSVYLQVVQMKIEEMKDTAANRDVNSGGTGSGVTAAAAIAALQEAGNKASRDMIAASYRADTEIVHFCIELIRQFYDETRSFRIAAPNGTAEMATAMMGGQQNAPTSDGYAFVELDNSRIKDQVVGKDGEGNNLYRRPVFDLKLKAQKKNPFSRMEQNETAKDLYSMGFFNPQRAQESMLALDMMDFEGIEEIREKVQQGQTLLNVVQQLQQQNALLMAFYAEATGQAPAPAAGAAQGGTAAPTPSAPAGGGKSAGDGLASGIMQAQTPMTGYGQRLAERSSPNMARG